MCCIPLGLGLLDKQEDWRPAVMTKKTVLGISGIAEPVHGQRPCPGWGMQSAAKTGMWALSSGPRSQILGPIDSQLNDKSNTCFLSVEENCISGTTQNQKTKTDTNWLLKLEWN